MSNVSLLDASHFDKSLGVILDTYEYYYSYSFAVTVVYQNVHVLCSHNSHRITR